MNTPYGLHLVQAECRITQAFHFTIPSPMSGGKPIRICADIQPSGNNDAFMEIWGALPDSVITQGSCIKLAETTFPRPAMVEDSHLFMQRLTQAIIKNPVFQQAAQEFIRMHLVPADEEK